MMARSRPAWLLAAIGGTALAQSAGGDFAIERAVIAGGSRVSGGGDFIVTGTAGQHDAAPPLQGGDFRVQGGFWPERGSPPGPVIFRDGFETTP